MSKPIVIYHKGCIDGVAAAWCFWRLFGNNLEYFPGVYQEAPPDVSGRVVYLVDFSYKRAVVEELCKTAEKVFLIDHHKSALEDLEGISAPNFYSASDLGFSGCMLAWRYLNGEDLPPLFLEYIEDRDLWKFKLPDCKSIMMALFSYPITFETFDDLYKMSTTDFLRKMTAEGTAILRKYDLDLETAIKATKRIVIFEGYQVPIANLNGLFASDAGNQMAVDYPFSVTYYDSELHRNFSLRSLEIGADVSVIAATYGGGGHKHAAGFKVARSHPLASL